MQEDTRMEDSPSWCHNDLRFNAQNVVHSPASNVISHQHDARAAEGHTANVQVSCQVTFDWVDGLIGRCGRIRTGRKERRLTTPSTRESETCSSNLTLTRTSAAGDAWLLREQT